MNISKDPLGDRMKGYEAAGEGARLNVMLPIYIRLDGRSFHRFVLGMDKPFDNALSQAMIETTKNLVAHTNARIGYTQSDEISLVYQAKHPESDIIFNGRTQKLVSVIAALTTVLFNKEMPEYIRKLPHFDCRVCQLPSRGEAANMFLWRWKDATKNAIQTVARSQFSASQLFGKRTLDMMYMIREKGVEFEKLPAFFRCGTFARRERYTLTAAEVAALPMSEKYPPDKPIVRHRICTFHAEDFITIPDREAFIFGEDD